MSHPLAPLRAPLEIEFDYTRSLGPVLSQFMTALADRRILGARGADGRVHAPPFEYDPVSSDPPGELIAVGPEGTVVSWSWMPDPLEGQPLTEPFAWALIRLDGADTAMLHAVDAGSAAAMRTGLRVRPRWSANRVGSIRDIACFEPCDAAGAPSRPRPDGTSQVSAGMIVTPVRLHYEHTASPGESAYLRGLAEGRLLGQRCGVCGQVYVPPRGTCPADGVPTHDEVELPDSGTVTSFCIVNVGYPGQRVDHSAVRGGGRAPGRGRHRVPAPHPGLRPRRRADGHAGQGRVERLGERQPLRADRGAGRAVRDLCEAPVTEVAVVGFAQSPCGVREDATTSGVEMLVPIFAEVFGATGLTKADIGFWCSGSCDYLAGRAFSFVSAVDAIGAVPPAMESHVEMDGAWALYEAWVKILTGEAEIALAYGFGKSSGAELRRVLALQLDPYLLAPLWPDSVSVAALQARLGLEAGRWTEKDMAEVAARSRAAAVGQPAGAGVRGGRGLASCWDARTWPNRCGRMTAPRSATGPRW